MHAYLLRMGIRISGCHPDFKISIFNNNKNKIKIGIRTLRPGLSNNTPPPPPPGLYRCYNTLKPPWLILKKAVNTKRFHTSLCCAVKSRQINNINNVTGSTRQYSHSLENCSRWFVEIMSLANENSSE